MYDFHLGALIKVYLEIFQNKHCSTHLQFFGVYWTCAILALLDF